MKIKKIEIYGYGKWVDQTFNLNDGLQIFIGENEAGKSTLMSFIHSILFGFPTRNSTLLRYEPLESSRYGGKIIGEDSQLGEIMIERIHGKVTGDVTVTLEDGSTGSDDLLARILKGIDRDNFQSIFSFSLTDIENVHQLDRDKLSRYLLNIGAHSTDYYLDLVDDFQKDAYDLYRPSGRIPPLNKELAIIKKQEKKLKQIEARNESYLELINQHQEQDEVIKRMEKEVENLKKELAKLEALEKDFHLLEEIGQLEKEIKNSSIRPLKKDGPYLLKENKKHQIEIDAQLLERRDLIKEIKKDLVQAEEIDHYQEYEEEIKKLEEKLPDKVSELELLKQIDNRIQRNEERLVFLQSTLKISEKDPTISAFSSEEKQKIKKLIENYQEVAEKIDYQREELDTLASVINQKNDKADYFEDLMWDQEYLAQIENKIESHVGTKVQEDENREPKGTKIIQLLGAVIIIASFFIKNPQPIYLISLGSLLILFSLLFKGKNKKQEIDKLGEREESFEILNKEYQNQLKLQADWQNLLAEIDAVQREYQENKNIIEEKSQLKNEYKKEWRILLSRHEIPPVHSMMKADDLVKEVDEFLEIKKEQEMFKGRQDRLIGQLEEDFSILQNILPETKNLIANEKIYSFRKYLKEINQLIASEKEKMNQLSREKEKSKELDNQKEKLVLERKHLLDNAGVETEEEFYHLYEAEEKLKMKKSRLEFLKENTKDLTKGNKIRTKKELIDNKEALQNKLAEFHEEIGSKIDERAKTKVSIQNLEKDGRYSEALQEFESQKARIQNLVDEWISDKLAASIIQRTLNQVTKDRFEEIIEEVNSYFSYLTDGKYTNIVFKEDELFVQDQAGRVIEVKTLSRGTAEPLYVAIRFAYIVQLQDVIKLPIIMDDPFVNFDQKRKEKMHRLLNNLSDQIQIIYFTFESSLKKDFDSNQIVDLNEEIS